MKQSFFCLLILFSSQFAFGQSLEFSSKFNSGLFSFGGGDAEKSSILIIGSNPYYAGNTYGRGSSFSFGFDLQLQKIIKGGLIFGSRAGFESLKSKTTIKYTLGSKFIGPQEAKGKSINSNQFINFNPYVGKRISVHGVDIDITPGLDIAFFLSSKEKVNARDLDGRNKYKSQRNLSNPSIDLRPRVDVAANYKNVIVTVGYSYGIIKYTSQTMWGNSSGYSRYLRLGVGYTFKKCGKS